jgi:hypothetical protein
MELDRRSFMGVLAAVLVQGRGWNDLSELPPPPAGFDWTTSDVLQARLIVPYGWHYYEEHDNGSSTVYISPLPAKTYSHTKFAVNIVPRMQTGGLPVNDWCKAFLMVCLEGQTPLFKTQDESSALPWYCLEKIDPPNDWRPARRIRIHGVVNPATDTLYLVQFESPADEWDEAWKIGGVFYNELNLNKRV